MSQNQKAQRLAEYFANIPEWQNDSRCTGLFANMPPQRDFNPSAFDDKFNFWRRLLMETSRLNLIQSKDSYYVLDLGSELSASSKNSFELDRVFSRNGLSPKCLKPVLSQLLKRGEIEGLEQFQMSLKQTGTNILSSIMTGSFSYGLQFVTNSLEYFGIFDSPSLNDTRLPHSIVLKHLLVESAQKITQHMKSPLYYTDSLFIDSEFIKIASDLVGTELSNRDLKLLLDYLVSTKQASSFTDPKTQNTMIKISPNSSINEVDKGVLSIRHTMKLLEKQIADLQSRADEHTIKAKYHVSQKQTNLAKQALKSRKLTANLLEQRLNSLHQLETLSLKLQHAHTETEILNAYQSGASSLSTFMKSNGLSVERVDEVMDSLNDVLADQNEINFAMRQLSEEVSASVGLDDSQLEDELEKMLEEEQKVKQAEADRKAEEFLSETPKVPNTLIETSEPPAKKLIAE